MDIMVNGRLVSLEGKQVVALDQRGISIEAELNDLGAKVLRRERLADLHRDMSAHEREVAMDFVVVNVGYLREQEFEELHSFIDDALRIGMPLVIISTAWDRMHCDWFDHLKRRRGHQIPCIHVVPSCSLFAALQHWNAFDNAVAS